MQSLSIVVVSMTIFLQQATFVATQRFDIVQTAINAGSFQTLAKALESADLLSALKGVGPFTVFAPTDAAFDKLAPGTLLDLLKTENKGKLAQILKYHVLAKNLTAAQINAMNTPSKEVTLEGRTIQVDKHGNHVQINDATVTQADIMATNGVIHVIDRVLMPAPAPNSGARSCLSQTFLFIFVFTIFFSSRRFL